MFNKFKATATIAAAALAALALTACDPSTVEGKPVPTTERTVSPVKWTAPTSTIEIPKVDPYSSNGTWLVPSEIAPGTYRAQGTRGYSSDPSQRTGYIEVCADYACDIDVDGSDFTGMISNDFFKGSTIVVVPAHAVSVELSGAVLTPMEG